MDIIKGKCCLISPFVNLGIDKSIAQFPTTEFQLQNLKYDSAIVQANLVGGYVKYLYQGFVMLHFKNITLTLKLLV